MVEHRAKAYDEKYLAQRADELRPEIAEALATRQYGRISRIFEDQVSFHHAWSLSQGSSSSDHFTFALVGDFVVLSGTRFVKTEVHDRVQLVFQVGSYVSSTRGLKPFPAGGQHWVAAFLSLVFSELVYPSHFRSHYIGSTLDAVPTSSTTLAEFLVGDLGIARDLVLVLDILKESGLVSTATDAEQVQSVREDFKRSSLNMNRKGDVVL